MAPKRKRPAVAIPEALVPQQLAPLSPSPSTSITSTYIGRAQGTSSILDHARGPVFDGADASRASPDDHTNSLIAPATKSESPLSDIPEAAAVEEQPDVGRKKRAKAAELPARTRKAKESGQVETRRVIKSKNTKNASPSDDPEVDGVEETNEEEVQQALTRPPPVNSDYLPLPWKGRLGYACLNTYLRVSNPPVFSSRTCRIASILDHRHPLQDPTQPEHPTKNRPDKSQPADVRRGQEWVEQLGLQNARDIVKMIRWNDRYGIKFMRLSSEMFPFASHEEYGYKLAPFAAETLAEAGRVIADLGHRVTTHPGQFTQLGSPRKVVVDNAIRDLEYHDEMLSLLRLPPQQDRDAVCILHMGGTFGSKPDTLDRFRQNYAGLSRSVKNRLVLENDDVGWSVHDLLPVCEELNIPLVLDFHHHNIVFDASQIREGTKDIMDLFPRILATWKRKNITPKMHYSEPTPSAITPRQRRKHSPRVATLPPCPADMDLMIEAKDKEQAVFELMRTFRLPGHERVNEMVPHVREDDNKMALSALGKLEKKKNKRGSSKTSPRDNELQAADQEERGPILLPLEEVGMGGPEGRVYWPPGMEEWLRPKKRVVAGAGRKRSPSDAGGSATDEDAEVKQSPKRVRQGVRAKAKVSGSTNTKTLRARKSVITPGPSDEEELVQNEDGSVDIPPKLSNGRTTKAKHGRAAAKVNSSKTSSKVASATPAAAQDGGRRRRRQG